MNKKSLNFFAIARRIALTQILFFALPAAKSDAQIAPACTPSFVAPGFNTMVPCMITGEASTSINDATTVTAGYGNLIGSFSVTLYAGKAYTVTTSGHDGGNIISSQIWIDFNNNGTFETSESVGGAQDYETPPGHALITIPSWNVINAGTYRMRVEIGDYVHGSSIPSPDEQYYPQLPPCPTGTTGVGSEDKGEMRDYTVVIQTPPVDTVFPTSVTFAPTASGAYSAAYNLTFKGAKLSPTAGSFTVTAPAGFQVYNGTTWGTTETISYTGGSLAATTIQVRFAPTSTTTFTGNLTIAGGGVATNATVALTGIGAAACSGTPSAGTASGTPAVGNQTTVFTLTDAGYTVAGGLGFQWMSCPTRSGTYTAITGANTPIYQFTGLTATTYYICVASCSTSNATSDTFSLAYVAKNGCIPYALECATDCPGGNYVIASASQHLTMTGVPGSTINDGTPCNGTGYTDLTATQICTVTVNPTTTTTYTLHGPGINGNTTQVWIDFNSNGLFETSESVGGGASGSSITLTIPSTVTVHPGSYRMRVETVEGGASETAETLSYPSLVSCMASATTKHGEARDYTITVGGTSTLNPSLGTNNISNGTTAVNIYPNPAHSMLYIETAATVNVELMSATGKVVAKANNTQSLDISNLANGVYIISVYDYATGVKIKTDKIVKIGN